MTQNLRDVWSEVSTNPRLLLARIAIIGTLSSLYFIWGHGVELVMVGFALTTWTNRAMAQEPIPTRVVFTGKAGEN